MTLTELEQAVRAFKAAGHSKMPVPLITLDRLIAEAKKAGSQISIEQEAKRFANRDRDVIRVLA